VIARGVPGGFDEVSQGREEIKCQPIKYRSLSSKRQKTERGSCSSTARYI
jgi:hypothetical protein